MFIMVNMTAVSVQDGLEKRGSKYKETGQEDQRCRPRGRGRKVGSAKAHLPPLASWDVSKGE
jgi:hypothetical protein